MTFVAAANYSFGVLSSSLFAVYAILVPALRILIIGLVMLKGTFSKITAYLGVVTGILGIISVVGPVLVVVSVLTYRFVEAPFLARASMSSKKVTRTAASLAG